MLKLTLRTLRLCVDDVAGSRDFYQRLLASAPRENEDNFVLFDLGGTQLEIAGADEKNPPVTGGCIGYFQVDSVADAIARAGSLGAVPWRGPLKINEQGWTIVQMKDPAGSIIGFEGKP